MARRPYRHRILEVPISFIRVPSPQPPRSADQYVAFIDAAISGLLHRLHRKSRTEAEAVREAVRWAYKRFGTWVLSEGLETAERNTFGIVATLSARNVAATKKPSPFDLLSEYGTLIEGISPLRSYQQRKHWLRDHEKMSEKKTADVAHHFGAELAERILAHRHGMSYSAMHKALAKATKGVKAYRRSLADLPQFSFVRTRHSKPQ